MQLLMASEGTAADEGRVGAVRAERWARITSHPIKLCWLRRPRQDGDQTVKVSVEGVVVHLGI